MLKDDALVTITPASLEQILDENPHIVLELSTHAVCAPT